jgi:hypothetical protein
MRATGYQTPRFGGRSAELGDFDRRVDDCKAEIRRERFFDSLAEKPKPYVYQRAGFDWQIWLFWFIVLCVWCNY